MVKKGECGENARINDTAMPAIESEVELRHDSSRGKAIDQHFQLTRILARHKAFRRVHGLSD